MQKQPSSPRRPRTIALIALAALLLVPGAGASGASADELKARFVVQLLKYVTWPDSALPEGSPFVVGVVGDEVFATAFQQLVGTQQVQGRAVAVRTAAAGAVPDADLLFVGSGASSDLRQLAREYHGVPVLTVADRFEFAELGGDVGLELVGDRVSFSINRRKSVRGDLVISSKLLRLASEVK